MKGSRGKSAGTKSAGHFTSSSGTGCNRACSSTAPLLAVDAGLTVHDALAHGFQQRPRSLHCRLGAAALRSGMKVRVGSGCGSSMQSVSRPTAAQQLANG